MVLGLPRRPKGDMGDIICEWFEVCFPLWNPPGVHRGGESSFLHCFLGLFGQKEGKGDGGDAATQLTYDHGCQHSWCITGSKA